LEATLNWSTTIRQTHRWVSIAFTITVIANIVVLSVGQGAQPPAWITFSPLLPLVLLMISGLYLFMLPYVAKWQRGRRSHTIGTR
jgi:hypothetical protein